LESLPTVLQLLNYKPYSRVLPEKNPTGQSRCIHALADKENISRYEKTFNPRTAQADACIFLQEKNPPALREWGGDKRKRAF
jgi:hypothetical protein